MLSLGQGTLFTEEGSGLAVLQLLSGWNTCKETLPVVLTNKDFFFPAFLTVKPVDFSLIGICGSNEINQVSGHCFSFNYIYWFY